MQPAFYQKKINKTNKELAEFWPWENRITKETELVESQKRRRHIDYKNTDNTFLTTTSPLFSWTWRYGRLRYSVIKIQYFRDVVIIFIGVNTTISSQFYPYYSWQLMTIHEEEQISWKSIKNICHLQQSTLFRHSNTIFLFYC